MAPQVIIIAMFHREMPIGKALYWETQKKGTHTHTHTHTARNIVEPCACVYVYTCVGDGRTLFALDIGLWSDGARWCRTQSRDHIKVPHKTPTHHFVSEDFLKKKIAWHPGNDI